MSWLARSIANSLRLEDNDEEDDEDRATNHNEENDVAPANHHEEGGGGEVKQQNSYRQQLQQEEEEEGGEGFQDEEEDGQGRGVREDLTELGQTLSRQLWGVASFLAPPAEPSVSHLDQSSDDEGEPPDSERIGHDFAQIGGRISKMASNHLPFGSEDDRVLKVEKEGEEEGEEEDEEEREVEQANEEYEDWEGIEVVGLTDEVLAFAGNIAMHPETWLDFPLDEEEDLDDFEMSDAQIEHALAIERLAPRLAALRTELCPCHMTESYFWKVYFVLLHSRLNKHDAEILSTAQVMEARSMWMQELHKQTKPESDWCGRSLHVTDANISSEDFDSPRTFHFEETPSTTIDYETESHAVAAEMQFIDKAVIEEKPVVKAEDKDSVIGPSSRIAILNYEDDDDDDDDWPDEEDSDLGGYKTIIPMGNEEDISFSDLEDDTCDILQIKSKASERH
ncbi:hypothetical protein Tsubulata_024943 [Turnera subulata]|uniref:BSD domain-containing protein n=1 Tax=Turnera subulata TaxID=218843 RepID=A0A9Q0G6C5_9ROSI|nr:hypothetical protein Tsubulata_024943 [Turnera subulata]